MFILYRNIIYLWLAFGPLLKLVQGQSCCMATGNYSLSSVGRCQKGVVATKLEYTKSLGSFNPRGEFQWENHSSKSNWTQYIGAGYSFWYPHFEMGVNIPVVLSQNRKISSESNISYLIQGDLNINSNLILFSDIMSGISSQRPESWVPFVTLNFGVKIPTGISSFTSKEWSQSDVTSTGYFQINSALYISKFLTQKWILGLSGNYDAVFEKEVSMAGNKTLVNPGNVYGGGISLSYIKNLTWSFDGSASFSGSGLNHINKNPEPNSEVFSSAIGFSITRALVVPYWQLQLGGSSNPWYSGFGKNFSFAGYKTHVTLRRNFL